MEKHCLGLESELSMEKLLIWDIDGTLLSCKGAGRISLNKTFKDDYDIENAFDNIEMAGKMDINILKSILDKNKIDEYEINDIIYKYGLNLRRQLEENSNLEILPNVKINLQNSQNDNRIYNVIASGNSEVGGILKLKKAKIHEHFKIGSYGNNFEYRACLVRNAINIAKFTYDINFSHDNIYMIGDTPDDIIAGKDNNIKTVALATGGYSYDMLKEIEPDYLFEELPENLIDILMVVDK
ncbi:MAG: HAD hydrolase-like protein [Bacillota bacterium]|nr:HAD hydrolase-like protein [Bacillota bacterium]